MRIVILTGPTSSSVLGGSISSPDEADDHTEDYLHGDEGRRLIGDADVVVGIWPPSDQPIVVRAPEGVEIQALDGSWAYAANEITMHDSITEEQFRERLREELGR